MGSRWSKAGKKAESLNANSTTFIERLRKMRALNCSPSDVGIDVNILRKFESHKTSGLVKLL